MTRDNSNKLDCYERKLDDLINEYNDMINEYKRTNANQTISCRKLDYRHVLYDL